MGEEMNRKEVKMIKAEKGAKYVHEFLNELPYGILNKKKTGCGATSMMLENKADVIVCCPTKQLINNKVGQYPNVRCPYTLLGVQEGVGKDDIKQYIAECEEKGHPAKILVTYNSFHKIATALGCVDEFHIVVDEYQELLDACVYREDAILRLLEDLKGKSNVTYLSATPIKIEHEPKELAHLDYYEIDWEEKDVTCPFRIKTKYPFATVENMIARHKNGEVFLLGGEHPVKEFYFFLNSTRAIAGICRNTGLSNDDVKVICADNDGNKQSLGDLKISSVSDPNKPFTFCTKTAFCGADFYSKSGLIVIVSDGRYSNTRLNIATDITQIAGRIRNEENPFRHTLIHIFNTGLAQSEEKYKKKLAKNIKFNEHFINIHNRLENEEEKEAIRCRIRKNDINELALFNKETGNVEMNLLKLAYIDYKHKITDIIYRNGYNLRDAYLAEGYDMSVAQKNIQSLEEYAYNIAPKSSFKELCLEYYEEMKRCTFGISPRAKEIIQEEPLIDEAYRFCAKEEIEALQYNKRKVTERIYENRPETKKVLKSRVTQSFAEGERYLNSEVKDGLQSIYNDFLVKRKAVATDIKKYFKAKNVKIPLENGKRKDGVMLGHVLVVHGRIKQRLMRLKKIESKRENPRNRRWGNVGFLKLKSYILGKCQ